MGEVLSVSAVSVLPSRDSVLLLPHVLRNLRNKGEETPLLIHDGKVKPWFACFN